MDPRDFLTAIHDAPDSAAALERVRPIYAGIDEAHQAFRDALVVLLWNDRRAADLPLLRALIEAEIERAHEEGGCGPTLYALTFLLYRSGEKEDVFLILRARYVDMDTGSTIDRQMLTMGRPRADMLAFLDASEPSDSSRKLHAELAQYYDRPYFESDAAYIEGMEKYFAGWKQAGES